MYYTYVEEVVAETRRTNKIWTKGQTFGGNSYEHITERCGRVVNTPASYFGSPGFKSRPTDRLSRLRFPVVMEEHTVSIFSPEERAICSSETLLSTDKSWRSPEDEHRHHERGEELKSHVVKSHFKDQWKLYVPPALTVSNRAFDLRVQIWPNARDF
jgi:hypothetical protein